MSSLLTELIYRLSFDRQLFNYSKLISDFPYEKNKDLNTILLNIECVGKIIVIKIKFRLNFIERFVAK